MDSSGNAKKCFFVYFADLAWVCPYLYRCDVLGARWPDWKFLRTLHCWRDIQRIFSQNHFYEIFISFVDAIALLAEQEQFFASRNGNRLNGSYCISENKKRMENLIIHVCVLYSWVESWVETAPEYFQFPKMAMKSLSCVVVPKLDQAADTSKRKTGYLWNKFWNSMHCKVHILSFLISMVARRSRFAGEITMCRRIQHKIYIFRFNSHSSGRLCVAVCFCP